MSLTDLSLLLTLPRPVPDEPDNAWDEPQWPEHSWLELACDAELLARLRPDPARQWDVVSIKVEAEGAGDPGEGRTTPRTESLASLARREVDLASRSTCMASWIAGRITAASAAATIGEFSQARCPARQAVLIAQGISNDRWSQRAEELVRRIDLCSAPSEGVTGELRSAEARSSATVPVTADPRGIPPEIGSRTRSGFDMLMDAGLYGGGLSVWSTPVAGDGTVPMRMPDMWERQMGAALDACRRDSTSPTPITAHTRRSCTPSAPWRATST